MGVTASVVVCAYTEDRWEHLSAALESVLHQTQPAAETILVVDYNEQLRARAEEAFGDVKVVPNTATRGLSGARNTGVAAATGDVVAFLDDDAVAAPDWLELLAEPFENTGVVAVGGRAIPRWEGGKPGWFPEEFNWVVGCTYTGHRAGPGPVRNVIGCNMALRRDAIEAAGGFRSELGRVGTRPVGGEETELSIRIGRDRPGAEVWYQPGAVVSHFVPSTRTTWDYFRSRCYAEGTSKALITDMVGAGDGLSSERSYTLKVLPRGIWGGVLSWLRGGDRAGLTRAAAIIAGLVATTAGYLRGLVGLRLDRAVAAPRAVPPATEDAEVTVSVVIATRDRAERLDRCLQSIFGQTLEDVEVVVVDNAPSSDETARLIAGTYPGRVTYLREDRPGLARAHNAGIRAAGGSLLVFTDDDVAADPTWLESIVAPFADPAVGCVTGRIVPLELETTAQRWLDSYAGFSKGEERRTFDLGEHRPADRLFPYAAGRFGSGANMAFRASVLDAVDGFDDALGAGSAAYGGDDLAAFFDVVAHGYRLVYEPEAVVHHEHHRDQAALRRVVFGYGAGLTAYLTKTVADRPVRLFDLIRRAPEGLRYGIAADSERNRRVEADYPRSLRRRELAGMAVGPFAYLRSRLRVRRLGRS